MKILPLDPNDPITPYVEELDGNDRWYWFDSTDTMIDLCSRPADQYKDRVPFKTTSEGGWWGVKDMPTALKYFKYGWEEVADSIYVEDAALAIPREIQDQFKTYADHSGGAVNVTAHINGQPEDMLQFEPSTQKKRTIRLLVNVSASGGTGSDYMKQRGMTIISIIDWLEKSGYRVRLDVCDTLLWWPGGYSEDKAITWLLAFCAKDYSQPLDISRLGFMAASSAMLRRIFFGIEAVSTDFKRIWGAHDYGVVATVPKKFAEKYDYVFDYMTPITMETAVQCIEYILTGNNPVERPEDIEALPQMMSANPNEVEDFSNMEELAEAMSMADDDSLQETAVDMPLTVQEQMEANAVHEAGSPDDPYRWIWDRTHSYIYPIKRKP